MSKNLILYKSKWGTTISYARWIQRLVPGTRMADIEELPMIKDIDDYSKIVLASSTYMGRIIIADEVEKKWVYLKNKRLLLVSVGMVPIESPETIEAYNKIPPDIRRKFEGHIKLPGKIDPSKLKLYQKLIVNLLNVKKYNSVDKNSIIPIVQWLKVD